MSTQGLLVYFSTNLPPTECFLIETNRKLKMIATPVVPNVKKSP